MKFQMRKMGPGKKEKRKNASKASSKRKKNKGPSWDYDNSIKLPKTPLMTRLCDIIQPMKEVSKQPSFG